MIRRTAPAVCAGLSDDGYGPGYRSSSVKKLQKGIPFPNTIKYIFVFKEGINHGSWFRLKSTVLIEAGIGTPERIELPGG